MTKNEFNPDYGVAPGEIIKEWCEETGVTADGLAERIGVDPRYIHGLFAGTAHLGASVAYRLEGVTGIGQSLLMGLHRSWREFQWRNK